MARSGNMQTAPIAPVTVIWSRPSVPEPLPHDKVTSASHPRPAARPGRAWYDPGLGPATASLHSHGDSGPREQIARLPEQPGVYLYYNAKGETIYVGKARSLRDRMRSYLGAYGMSPRHDALLDEAVASRSDRHRLGGRGAGAREQPDQAAVAEVQHPAARRQELSLPAAHDDRGVSARAGGALGGARRQRLCGSVPARQVRAPDHVADPQGVRHPVVQRGDHRAASAAVPRTRHQALPGAVRRHDLQRRAIRGGGGRHAGCSSKGRNEELADQLRARMVRSGASTSGSRRPRSCATRCARCRRCASASRRWRRRSSAIATCSA